jgi:hypothetical protein
VEKMRNISRILITNPGRPRHREEDNIKAFLRKMRWKSVGWIHMNQDKGQGRAFVNTVMNLRVLCRGRKLLSSFVTMNL